MSKIDTLRGERDEARSLATKMVEADSFNETDPGFMEAQSRAAELDKRIAVLAEIEESRSAADSVDASLSRFERSARAPGEARTTQLTPGEQYTRSDAWQNYQGVGTSQRLEIEGMISDGKQMRAPLELSDLGGIQAQQFNLGESMFKSPVVDSMSVIPTTGSSVEVLELQITDNAAVVAEGADKPESTFEQVVTPYALSVKAHWTQYSRQLAQDEPAIVSRIDGKLRRGINRVLEAEAAAAVVAKRLVYPSIVNADLLTGIRIAIGDLQDVTANTEGGVWDPSHVYMNTADWAAFDTAIAGRRTDGGTQELQFTYWGLTVVPCAGMAAGEAVVADAKQAFEVYRRTSVGVYTTDSHAATFIANTLTTLAEARQVSVVVDPTAARLVSLIEPTAAAAAVKAKKV